MNNDELQILGTEKPKKKNKVVIAIIALVALLVIGGIYFVISSQQPEKIRTGKKLGEPTIIPELQTAVDSILLAELELIDALQGQAIVMDVKTGEILAMVGLERKHDGTFQPCNNIVYQQKLGQMTMTASLLAVLETGKTSLSDVVHTGEGVRAFDNGLEMRDHNWRRGGYGSITLDKALAVSSIIGIGMAVNNVFGDNEQQFFSLLEKMGFGQPDHIDGIEGLKATTYSSPKDSDWANWKLWQSAVGYERKMAPIQMLTFYNAIANNGKMVKPTLKTGEIEIINPQIASKANIDSIQVALEQVVSQGLGRRAGLPTLKVAGKTSTSHVELFDYYNEAGIPFANYQLAFCGYFPADVPKYSIIVSMNKLGIPASGGAMAGAVFHDIVEWMITHSMLPVLFLEEETNDTI